MGQPRKHKLITNYCLNCGKEIHTDALKNKRYCCRHCVWSYKKKQNPTIIIKCLKCGKEIETTSKMIARGRDRFCSISCSSSYNNKGKKRSKESIERMSNASKGRIPWNKGEWIKLICAFCGSGFEVTPARANIAKYCSKKCHDDSRRGVIGPSHPLWTRELMACEWCGKEVYVKPAKFHEFRFCSKQCQGYDLAKRMSEWKGPTSIEQALMDELDARGVEYKTQHKIANWLIDITLPQYRIAIEADGDYWHSSKEQQEKDARKNHWLKAHKWKVFRFWGSEIRESPIDCIDQVEAFLLNGAIL